MYFILLDIYIYITFFFIRYFLSLLLCSYSILLLTVNLILRIVIKALLQVGLKMFLGITGQVTDWDSEKKEFSLISFFFYYSSFSLSLIFNVLEDNPLIEFVELPEQYNKLWYSNILCGVIRGALEMVRAASFFSFFSLSSLPSFSFYLFFSSLPFFFSLFFLLSSLFFSLFLFVSFFLSFFFAPSDCYIIRCNWRWRASTWSVCCEATRCRRCGSSSRRSSPMRSPLAMINNYYELLLIIIIVLFLLLSLLSLLGNLFGFVPCTTIQ